MNQSTSAPRIDEILRRQGLISEEQIKAALQYQREHGGRLGSHLVRLGFVTEAQLLAALSEQFGCESVALSQVSISLEVTRMLPVNVVLARTVMPFGFDQATNTLGVACEDPTDNTLLEELRFVAKGKNIRLHVAAEMSLRSAIAEHYVAVAEAPLAEPPESAAGDPAATDLLDMLARLWYNG